MKTDGMEGIVRYPKGAATVKTFKLHSRSFTREGWATIMKEEPKDPQKL